MWPFGDEKVAGRLKAGGAGGEPARVSVLTTIVSPSLVTSPVTGVRAAMIHLEIIERVPRQSHADLHTPDVSDTDTYEPLGILNLGDVATLRDEDGDEITVVVGRVRIDPQLPQRGGTPLTAVPAEVVPFLKQARGRGVICYRELALRDGDHVRLKAVVEPTRSVASSGYRSGTTVSYVARDDLAPVVLEEVLGSPF